MNDVKTLLLSFSQPEEFEKLVHSQPGQAGIFVDGLKRFNVGERVKITVTVAGINTPVYLDGLVVWKRNRGTEKQPVGTFIELLPRSRARLNSIIQFLKSRGAHERRRQRRYPISIRAIYKTAKGDYSSEVCNLSMGGAFLHCFGPLLSVGAKFPVVLLPQGKESSKLELMARVAWIDLFEEAQGMGVAFLEGQSGLKKVKKIINEYEKKLKQVG
ncbi:MAG: hypothetical protein D6806_08560 [Deltaproteobacteria bacterium]|nr:MAG: hypothetical protein D6806_08560 [Deltaproteobacteria bacterium]